MKLKWLPILSYTLLIGFVLDTWLHFVILPFDTIEWSWFSWKGDIDFTHIGIINVLLRLSLYAYFALSPKHNAWMLRASLLTVVVPTVFLVIDSWWVVMNYLSLYAYWFYILALVIAMLTFSFIPKYLMIWKRQLIALSLLCIPFIGMVYFDIMGLDWPVEFIYSFAQHVLYEALFLIVFILASTLTLNQTKS